MPEFMTKEMREQIGSNVLWPKHTAKIKGYLDRSETACDDTHKFNPSRFDMEHAMRINLKKDCDPRAAFTHRAYGRMPCVSRFSMISGA